MKEFWKKHKWAIIGFGSIGLFLLVLPWVISQHYSGISFNETGEIGDTIGGITAPFIGFFAAILVYLAFRAQIDANKSIQVQFKIQQFEDKFYSMVEFHKGNVKNMTIRFSDIIEFHSTHGAVAESRSLVAPKTRRDVEITDVEVINGMIAEFELAIEVIKKHIKPRSVDNNENVIEIAYNLFFLGFEDREFQKSVGSKLGLIRKKVEHFRDVFERRHSGMFQTVYWQHMVYYPPFYGHSARLPHYFRNLYHTVKIVVDNEKSKLLKLENSMDYLKLLRSQLTNNEQLLLYLNYRYSKYGKSWDITRDPSCGNEFLTKYKMIHNIPLNSISKQIESPRKHFENYIQESCSLENPLFEWGDYSS